MIKEGDFSTSKIVVPSPKVWVWGAAPKTLISTPKESYFFFKVIEKIRLAQIRGL